MQKELKSALVDDDVLTAMRDMMDNYTDYCNDGCDESTRCDVRNKYNFLRVQLQDPTLLEFADFERIERLYLSE